MQLSGNFEFDECNTDSFVVTRAKQLLRSKLEEKGVERITYIALKQQLISECGETEFGRNKCAIQKLLERAIRKENPKVAKEYAKGRAKQEGQSGKSKEDNDINVKPKPSIENAKSPRLYFYKMKAQF